VVITRKEIPQMSELIAFALASLPFMAMVALVVTAVRTATGPDDYPGVDLRYRSFGA
jgi:hypothetical protein